MQNRGKNNKQRTEQEIIGGTIYTVIAEEKPGTKQTPFEIIGGLVKRHYEDVGLAVCERTEDNKKWN